MNEFETEAAPSTKMIARDQPQPTPAVAALVKRILKDVEEARVHWRADYSRMRRNMKFANGKQWPGQTENDDRFMVNLIQRVVKSTVSALYAKNPTVVAKRRPKLDFKLWDGKAETVVQAQQAMAMASQVDPLAAAADPMGAAQIMQLAQQAQELMADIQQGTQRRSMLDKIGKTLVACVNYFLSDSEPGFKLQMKQMMRRARTTGVGYVKLGYQREMELSPDQNARIAEHADRLAVIGRLTADLQDGETNPDQAEAAELELAIATIKSEPSAIVREGLVWSFPRSTKIIPSTDTEQLMGWVGSSWLAEEIMLTPDRVKEVYGVDIGRSFTAFRTVAGSPQGGETRRIADSKGGLACVYEVHDRTTGMVYVVCEGYPGFLKEPGTPGVFIEQFFPVFAVTFNEVEEEGALFPKSDVELLTHIQKEFNRAKEALRQHRIANRPLYLSPTGSFEEEEVKSLETYVAHSVIQLNGIEKGRPASDVLAPVQKIGVDPNLYETNSLFEDMQRVTGNAEANLGGTAGGTATESSIAENSRQGSLGLDSDDLDDMLTALFRSAGTVLLTELSAEKATEIAGIGAVWPELTRDDVAKELWLEVKAGSSGRPNQARDAANFERIYPLLVQVPGISPKWLAEKAISIADDNADIEDAIIDGLPSIMAQNAQATAPTGDPATDPASQGGKGGDNKPKAEPARDNGQPGFPGAGAGGSGA